VGGGSAAASSKDGFGGGGGETSVGPPEHLSPGYGAGYDAGLQAGLLAASHGRTPPPFPPPPPVTADGGAGASAPEPARPPFLAVVEDFPDLFQKEVLERLDRVDRALLSRTGSTVRTAVVSSGLPRVGGSAMEPREGIEAFCKSLSTFVWAVANGCQWQFAQTCNTLARAGNLEVLQWAREHGCPLRAGTCRAAAECGHLEVLKWAREQDCQMNEATCRSAAGGGQLEVLMWLREHGYPWNEMTCAAAA